MRAGGGSGFFSQARMAGKKFMFQICFVHIYRCFGKRYN